MKKTLWWALVAAGAFLMGCHKEVPTPAYIYIEDIDVQTDPSNGAATAKVSDAWVFVNDQLIAVDELPTMLPTQIVGEQEVKILPGILDNGQSRSRLAYPFYNPFVVTRTLVPGEIDTLRPVVDYLTGSTVSIVEDFEGSGVVFGEDLDKDDTTKLERTTEFVRSGNYAGVVTLTDSHPQWITATTIRYEDLQQPLSPTPVYIELDYKSDIPFEVGLVAHLTTGIQIDYRGGGLSKENWTKLYLSFGESVYNFKAKEFGVAFRALKPTTMSEAKIYIDNVKLVYQK